MPSSTASNTASVSWKTDTVGETKSAPPSLAPCQNSTSSYTRRNVNVVSASNSGMKFQSWREPKPLRSRPATAINMPQTVWQRPVRRYPRALDTKVQQDVSCIVNRLSTPTFASKMKNIRAHPKTSMLNMNYYTWANMAVYRDYQKTLYKKDGTMRRSLKRKS